MENHPIPQDVTGFKFRLIGSITIKQFLYLLGAGIFATIIFISPLSPLLKIPFMMMFAGSGLAMAFIPIDGRPMDVMMFNFLRAIPAENRYVYHKQGAHILAFEPVHITRAKKHEAPVVNEKSAQLQSLYMGVSSSPLTPDTQEETYLKNVKQLFAGQTPSVPITPLQANPVEIKKPSAPVAPPVEKKPTSAVQLPTEKAAPAPLPPTPAVAAPVAQPDPVPVAQPAPQAPQAPPPVAPTSAAPPPPKPGTRVITGDAQLAAGFPSLPDVPNVIMGVVKDPRGKVLPNVLVEVLDQNHIPVRAFKTNKLGQFAAATPLPNGTYMIIFEDTSKKNEFDTIEVTLKSEIFQPLEVISVDQREKLRQELFEGAPH